MVLLVGRRVPFQPQSQPQPSVPTERFQPRGFQPRGSNSHPIQTSFSGGRNLSPDPIHGPFVGGRRGGVHLRPQSPPNPSRGRPGAAPISGPDLTIPTPGAGKRAPFPIPPLTPGRGGGAVQPQVRPVRPHAAAGSRGSAAGGGSATRGMSGALRGERRGSVRPGERGQPAPSRGRGTLPLSTRTKSASEPPPKVTQSSSGRAAQGAVRTARGSSAVFCPNASIAHRVNPLEPLLSSVGSAPQGGDGALIRGFPVRSYRGAPLSITAAFPPPRCVPPSPRLIYGSLLIPLRHLRKYLRAAALGAGQWRGGRRGKLWGRSISELFLLRFSYRLFLPNAFGEPLPSYARRGDGTAAFLGSSFTPL